MSAATTLTEKQLQRKAELEDRARYHDSAALDLHDQADAEEDGLRVIGIHSRAYDEEAAADWCRWEAIRIGSSWEPDYESPAT